MAEKMKTTLNKASVSKFLAKVKDPQKRADSQAIVRMMQEITGEGPAMWGSSIVGFGSYHYKYASGREGDMPIAGFSPRKESLTLYIMSGFKRYDELLRNLGKYKTSKACLYIKRLDDVHVPTLKALIRESVKVMRKLPRE
jgi:hypothetical protein